MKGIVVTKYGSAGRKALNPDWKFVTTSRGKVKERTEDLLFLRQLIDDVKLRAVIEWRLALEQAAGAHRYAEKKHKRGNVVLTVDQQSE
jgi:NADPH:quinone reductase-like Zn-dependent oxidoreductase